ncbi:hypothetical protein [Lysobacter humi (ex Lee et al. 2017)]
MGTIAPRSTVFRVLRNLSLLWFVGSLLGIALTVVLGGYALFARCSGSLLECAAGLSAGLLMFVASAVTAGIVLAFMQLFYMAGARVRSARPGSAGVDVIDALDIDDVFDGD